MIAPAAQVRNTATALVAEVIATRHVCREHVSIEMAVRAFPPSHPGQFLQLLCRGDDDAPDRVLDWRDGTFPTLPKSTFDHREPFTRRPFSIADRSIGTDGRIHLTVISRAVGVGTRWLDDLSAGQTLNITGPLGHGFELPDDRNTPLILIGGGVGIPPLLYLARVLRERGHADATLIVGARQRDLLPLALLAEPDANGDPTVCVRLPCDPAYPTAVTSDDGTLGRRGFVTDALQRWIACRGATTATRALALACGPEGMLKSIAQATRAVGMRTQLCIERNMGCGLGTCLSCVVRMRDPSKSAGWRWVLACTDGPVFDRDALPDYD